MEAFPLRRSGLDVGLLKIVLLLHRVCGVVVVATRELTKVSVSFSRCVVIVGFVEYATRPRDDVKMNFRPSASLVAKLSSKARNMTRRMVM